MPNYKTIAANDIIVLRSNAGFGVGLVIKILNIDNHIFADTLWRDGIIIRCSIDMLTKVRGSEL